MSDSLARHLFPAPEGDPGHAEIRSGINAYLKALNVPFSIDPDGDAVVPSKHGNVSIFPTTDGKTVVFSLHLGTVDNNPKKKAEFFRLLLQVNSGLTAAKVCLIGDDNDRQLPILVRAAANSATMSQQDLEWTLQSVLDLAAQFDD
jgi:hypothetical protein